MGWVLRSLWLCQMAVAMGEDALGDADGDTFKGQPHSTGVQSTIHWSSNQKVVSTASSRIAFLTRGNAAAACSSPAASVCTGTSPTGALACVAGTGTPSGSPAVPARTRASWVRHRNPWAACLHIVPVPSHRRSSRTNRVRRVLGSPVAQRSWVRPLDVPGRTVKCGKARLDPGAGDAPTGPTAPPLVDSWASLLT